MRPWEKVNWQIKPNIKTSFESLFSDSVFAEVAIAFSHSIHPLISLLPRLIHYKGSGKCKKKKGIKLWIIKSCRCANVCWKVIYCQKNSKTYFTAKIIEQKYLNFCKNIVVFKFLKHNNNKMHVLTRHSMNHVMQHFLMHLNFSIMNVCKLKYWHIIENAKMYLYVYILKIYWLKKYFFSQIFILK